MGVACRVIESRDAIITQSPSAGHNWAFDLVRDVNGCGAFDNVIAHSAGTVVAIRNNCSTIYPSEQAAIDAWGDSYGNFVLIKHSENRYTMYAHLSYNSVRVGVGQHVIEGQVIGYMGGTGYTRGGHLHFEVRTTPDWRSCIDATPYLNAPFEQPFSTTPVTRDETKNQLQINVTDLNVRVDVGTDKKIRGVATEGIYDYSEVGYANGYTWYKITDNQWVADTQGSITILPSKNKEEEKMIEELNNKIDSLNKQLDISNDVITSLTNQVKSYEGDVTKLRSEITSRDDKINLLEKDVANYREDYNSMKTFIAPTADNYYINLKEGSMMVYNIVSTNNN